MQTCIRGAQKVFAVLKIIATRWGVSHTCARFFELIMRLQTSERALPLAAFNDVVDGVADDDEAKKSAKSETD